LVTYLEVASIETTALQAQLSRVEILHRRMVASVMLVKALGGGWGTPSAGRSDAARVP
jgi:multidrug efflux system outer membrane protein